MIFFGKQVSDTGCEILVKVGSRFVDPKNPGHLISWRDGQIISVMPLGFHAGKQVGYCCTLLKFPNIDYTTIGGRWEKDWKKMPAEATLWRIWLSSPRMSPLISLFTVSAIPDPSLYSM